MAQVDRQIAKRLIEAAQLLLAHVTVANVKDAVAVVFPNLAIYSVGSNNLTLIDVWGNKLQCLEHFNLIKATGTHENLGPNDHYHALESMSYQHAQDKNYPSEYEEYLRIFVLDHVQQHLDHKPTPNTSDEWLHCFLAKMDALRSFCRGSIEGDEMSYKAVYKTYAVSAVHKFLNANQSNMLQAFHDLVADTNLYRNEAEDPRTSATRLEELFKAQSSPDVLFDIARNPNTSPQVLDALVSLRTTEARTVVAVAKNRNTRPDTLTWLFTTKNNTVTQWSTNESILGAVAANPNTTVPVLTLLAKHHNVQVRMYAADNTSLPVSLLEELVNDRDRAVCHHALMNPNIPSSYLETKATGTSEKALGKKSAQAKNTNTPADVLRKLSKDAHVHVRSTVASNPSTPPDVLEKLAKDKENIVVEAVAENPHTPARVLSWLANTSESDDVLRCLARNRNTPASTLVQLSGLENLRLTQEAARNPNMPQDQLQSFANYREMHNAVAANPHVPVSLLRQINSDHAYLRAITHD